jgi:hypothetical protein
MSVDSDASARAGNRKEDTRLAGLRDLDGRDVAALTRRTLAVVDTDAADPQLPAIRDVPDLFLVVSSHAEPDRLRAEEYLVDLRDASCTCPDARYRDVRCQHIRRAEFVTGRRTVPDAVDRSAVDPDLGAYVGGVR